MSMDLDGQIAAEAAARPADPANRPTAFEGTAVTAPASGVARVKVPGVGLDIGEPCRYLAPAGEPAAGDVCVVVFVDKGLPLALFPGVGEEGV